MAVLKHNLNVVLGEKVSFFSCYLQAEHLFLIKDKIIVWLQTKHIGYVDDIYFLTRQKSSVFIVEHHVGSRVINLLASTNFSITSVFIVFSHLGFDQYQSIGLLWDF